MVPGFVCYPAAATACRLSLSAVSYGTATHESSDHEEFGKSNLWFPNSLGPRGSKYMQAQPARVGSADI